MSAVVKYINPEVDAATVYNFYAVETFGEFARINTPDMGLKLLEGAE